MKIAFVLELEYNTNSTFNYKYYRTSQKLIYLVNTF